MLVLWLSTEKAMVSQYQKPGFIRVGSIVDSICLVVLSVHLGCEFILAADVCQYFVSFVIVVDCEFTYVIVSQPFVFACQTAGFVQNGD